MGLPPFPSAEPQTFMCSREDIDHAVDALRSVPTHPSRWVADLLMRLIDYWDKACGSNHLVEVTVHRAVSQTKIGPDDRLVLDALLERIDGERHPGALQLLDTAIWKYLDMEE